MNIFRENNQTAPDGKSRCGFRHATAIGLGVFLSCLFLAVPLFALTTEETLLMPGKKISRVTPGSLAVDTNGITHVVYSGSKTYYAYYDADQWHSTPIGTCPGRYETSSHSLHVDGAGNVHILFLDEDRTLVYAKLQQGKWEHESLYPSLASFSSAMDTDGSLHIFFWGAGGTHYTTNRTGMFVKTTISECCNSSLVIGEMDCSAPVYIVSPAITLDADSKAHVAYVCYSSSPFDGMKLKYATNIDGNWSISTVESSYGDGLKSPTINVAPDGKPHICYIRQHSQYISGWCMGDCNFTDFKHATNSSGIWEVETVGSSNHNTYGSDSLNTMPSGTPHLFLKSFATEEDVYHYFYGSFRYAKVADGDYVSHLIDGEVTLYSDSAPQSIAVARDSNGALHAAYIGHSDDHMKYALFSDGVWQEKKAEYSFYAGVHLSAATDSSGGIHLAFTDSLDKWLQYGTNISGEWRFEAIDETVHVADTDICVGSNGIVHIVYFDESGGAMRYARSSPEGWKLTALTHLSNAGRPAGIDVDSAGAAFVHYFDTVAERHLLASVVPNSGPGTTLADSDGRVMDLAIDSGDRFHACYFDEGTLYYASNPSGSLQIAPIGPVCYEPGDSCDIELDADSIPHVVYLTSENHYDSKSVRYATNRSGRWRWETIFDGYYTLDNAAIRVDTTGKIHVVASAIGYPRYITNFSGDWTVDTLYRYGEPENGIPHPLSVLPLLDLYIPTLTWGHNFLMLQAPPYRLQGDLNNNGTADISDLILLLQGLTGQPVALNPPASFHDINGNGYVDSAEVVWMLQRTAHIR